MERQSNRPLIIGVAQLDAIPNRITPQQRHWIPEEPLFGANVLDNSLPVATSSVAHLASTIGGFDLTRKRLRGLYREAIRSRLVRCLELCKKAAVDVLVLPEYSVPPELLEILIGYSTEMVVIAGLGVLRPSDIDDLGVELPRPALYNNCAVVVGPNGYLELVTKCHEAEGEFLEPGTGPRTLEIEVRGTTVRLGVAICQDYLHAGHSFAAEGRHVDLVAIPALSPNTEIFEPDQPRDFVRAFANHASFGGTAIWLPGLEGPAFTDRKGTSPALAGEETLIVVQYDKFQSKPTSTFSTRNRMLYRAAIIAGPSQFETQIIEAMQGLPLELPSNSSESEGLDSWINRTSGHPRLGGLNESLRAYKRLGMSGMLRQNDRLLLTTHLTVPNAQSSQETRISQVREVTASLRRLSDGDQPPTFFDIQAEYAKMLSTLQPAVKQDASFLEPAHPTRRTYAAFRLGQYNEAHAMRTFPYQLDLLRSFCITFNTDVTLTYRLTTFENPVTGDLSPIFDVILGGWTPVESIESDVKSFMRACRAIFVSGWNCSSSSAKIDIPGTYRYMVTPVRDHLDIPPAIREDWGAVVDVLRAQTNPMSLEISCNPLHQDEPTESANSHAQVAHQLGTDAKSFSSFIETQLLHSMDSSKVLSMQIVLSSSVAISRGLLNAITSMVLGHSNFAITELSDGETAKRCDVKGGGYRLRADEALRVFHPPHGFMAGRGLGGTRSLVLHAKDMPMRQHGCVIGRAVAARGDFDTSFNLAIDDESRLRHVYVVGKTGSGKTNLLKNMVRQDIVSGAGVAIIDPHGDLAEYALGHCGGRAADTVYLDFADPAFLPVMNPLTLDIDTDEQRMLAVEEVLDIITRRGYHEWYGPRFHDTVKLALDSLMVGKSRSEMSILDVPILLRDAARRRSISRDLKASADLKSRWAVFTAMRETEQAEVISWVLAKWAEIEQSMVLRHALAGRPSSFSIIEAVSEGKILIARLPEVTIGASAAALLGAILVSRISRHIVDAHPGRTSSRPFYLYVDEFQKFVVSGFETLIPEARKFGLGLVLAHQNTDQLVSFNRFEGTRSSSVLTQILGNVGNIVSFRVGRRDAELLSAELGVSASDLLRVGRYEAAARVVSDGAERDTVTIEISDSSDEPGYPEARERIRRHLRDTSVVVPIGRAASSVKDVLAGQNSDGPDDSDTEPVKPPHAGKDARSSSDVVSSTASPRFMDAITDERILFPPPLSIPDSSDEAESGAKRKWLPSWRRPTSEDPSMQ